MDEVFMPALICDRYTGFTLDHPEPVGSTVYKSRAGAQNYLNGYQSVAGVPMRYFTIIVYAVEG